MNYFVITNFDIINNRVQRIADVNLLGYFQAVNKEKYAASVTTELQRMGILQDDKLSLTHLPWDKSFIFECKNDQLTISEYEQVTDAD